MSYLTTRNQYIEVDNNRIAYRELNKGASEFPLVMLVHLAATLDNWDPKLIDLLATKQHLILLDLPGVGESKGSVPLTIAGMAHQAIAIIQALGYTKINLLGLSMGGMVAQEITLAEPNLVHKLILVGTGPQDGIGINKVTSTTFKYMFKAALQRTDPKRFIFYNHDEKGKIEANKVLNRLAERSTAYQDKPMKVSSFLRQLQAIKHWSTLKTNNLSTIQQPVLIVNGDNDMMVATENSYQMQQAIQNSQLIIYPQASHGSLFQYAEQFANDLLEFLG